MFIQTYDTQIDLFDKSIIASIESLSLFLDCFYCQHSLASTCYIVMSKNHYPYNVIFVRDDLHILRRNFLVVFERKLSLRSFLRKEEIRLREREGALDFVAIEQRTKNVRSYVQRHRAFFSSIRSDIAGNTQRPRVDIIRTMITILDHLLTYCSNRMSHLLYF